MLDKVIFSVSALSLVGSPMVCANSANVTQNVAQSREEKLSNFVISVIKGEVESNVDEIYERLREILPFEEQLNLDVVEYFGKVLVNTLDSPLFDIPVSEFKSRRSKILGALAKFHFKCFERLDKSAEVVAKAKSMYTFGKSCIDACIEGKEGQLASYFKENLAEGDTQHIFDLKEEIMSGNYNVDNAVLDYVSTDANYERICSDDRSNGSKTVCGSFFDFVSKLQSCIIDLNMFDNLKNCFDKSELKTGTTPAKPLNILIPESDEEYAALFKSRKVCNNKVEKN